MQPRGPPPHFPLKLRTQWLCGIAAGFADHGVSQHFPHKIHGDILR
jgi:hypothetical protein